MSRIQSIALAMVAAISLTGCRAEMLATAKNDCQQMGYQGQALTDCTFAQFNLNQVEFQAGMANMQQGLNNASNILQPQ
jgi:hypothetical protein